MGPQGHAAPSVRQHVTSALPSSGELFLTFSTLAGNLTTQAPHLASTTRGGPSAWPGDLLPPQLLRVEQPEVVVVPALADDT